jgi:hypothetical protein
MSARQRRLLPVTSLDRHDDHLVRDPGGRIGRCRRRESSAPPISRVRPYDVVHVLDRLVAVLNWISDALAKF